MSGKVAFVILLTFFVAACLGPKKLDPTAFIVDTGPKESIPKSCRAAYESSAIRVAVVNFTNNTTFDFAKSVTANVQGSGQRTAVGGAAVGAGPGVAGVVWGTREQASFRQDAQRIERQISAKLSESVEDGVTDEIVNMGGATVFTRNEMQKVMAEQNFQQSGLTDDRTLVQLGKLVGVKYVITGSIVNVDLAYKSFTSAKQQSGSNTGSALGNLLGAALAASLEAQEGWNIGTDVALRILNTETGEILFSKKVSGKHIIGKVPYPSYDALIGGMKKAAMKGIATARPELSKWFTVRGYILQTRTSPDGKERSALISIGEKQGLKPSSLLFVYTFQEIVDPFDDKKVSCDIVKLPIELEVTDQLQADKAWCVVSGKPAQISRIKAGQLVERKALQRGY